MSTCDGLGTSGGKILGWLGLPVGQSAMQCLDQIELAGTLQTGTLPYGPSSEIAGIIHQAVGRV